MVWAAGGWEAMPEVAQAVSAEGGGGVGALVGEGWAVRGVPQDRAVAAAHVARRAGRMEEETEEAEAAGSAVGGPAAVATAAEVPAEGAAQAAAAPAADSAVVTAREYRVTEVVAAMARAVRGTARAVGEGRGC